MTDAGRKGAVFDVGYRRYEGGRRSQRSRYRVIARNVVASSWRGWIRLKLPFAGVAIVAAIAGGLIYWATYIANTVGIPRGVASATGNPLAMIDFVVPGAFDAFTMLGFIIGLTVGAAVVAGDLRAGAFEFYFARPIRPVDYVAGKLLGISIAVGIALLAGPLLLAILRVGFSTGEGGVADSAHLVAKTMVAGVVATAAYSAVPLAWSAIAARPAYTIAGWAAFYILFGNMMVAIAHTTSLPALSALHIKASVMSIVYALFEFEMAGRFLFRPMVSDVVPPVWAAAAALALYTATSIGFVFWRIARAQKSGLGGG